MKHGFDNKRLFKEQGSYIRIFCFCIFCYAAFQWSAIDGFVRYFELPDADDAMRMVMVRDLLAGQGWFDTTQHRVLPPRGLHMHWSRLVDAPIAALELLFWLVLDKHAAEQAAAAAWPAILFVVFLVLLGWVTRSVFGIRAACFAMLAAAGTELLSRYYFATGRVDHHNVQIICMLVVAVALILPHRPFSRGVCGGMAAAISIAVGLEMLPVIALAVAMLALRCLRGEQEELSRLLGFGLAIGLVSPSLFIVQTAPADWGAMHCDQISPRLLIGTTVVMVVALIAWFTRERFPDRHSRYILASVVGAASAAILMPVAMACRTGPYGGLSEFVGLQAAEALAAWKYLTVAPVLGITYIIPTYALCLMLGLRLARNKDLPGSPAEQRAIWTIFGFLLLAAAGIQYQVRAVVWGLAILPMAFGVVFDRLLGCTSAAHVGRRAAIVLLAVFIIFPNLPSAAAILVQMLGNRQSGVTAGASPATASDCNPYHHLRSLDNLPQSTILATAHMNTQLLLLTRQRVASSAFHRNKEAWLNGFLPFFRDAGEMARRVEKYAVDYVLVCADRVYGTPASMGSRLARGELPPWLRQVDLGTGGIKVLKVLRDADGRLRQG